MAVLMCLVENMADFLTEWSQFRGGVISTGLNDRGEGEISHAARAFSPIRSPRGPLQTVEAQEPEALGLFWYACQCKLACTDWRTKKAQRYALSFNYLRREGDSNSWNDRIVQRFSRPPV